ncbi:uncharacterized protein BJX67DRAFT_385692 [Aspergillus lucknowensis]|uniref:Uncharacterized protein n=1 Tax=Aspergillus lucknowensis TaxID=176173 RepID=A0ABR4LFZ9_9EURO
MRWTKENEELLWHAIFKTQSFHIDLDKISEAWRQFPAGDEKPTPKALKEHLGKYRKSLGGENKITFGMGSKRCVEDGAGAPATPRKRTPKKPTPKKAVVVKKEWRDEEGEEFEAGIATTDERVRM